jgi:hypothetical protein
VAQLADSISKLRLTIELFQATKNAYVGPLSATLHTVEVWAEGSVDCRATFVACSRWADGTLYRASGPSQRKKVRWNPSMGVLCEAVGSQNGNS